MFDYINNIWVVACISLIYVALLFVVAIIGNKSSSTRIQPYVYSLTLAIFCTSWAFYGVIQQSIYNGWLLAPTYLGAIVLMTVGWKIMQRIIDVAKQENSTTISDFIAARYGHSRGIAVFVSILCLIGIIPYIALQLKAVSGSFQLITQTTSVQLSWFTDPTLVVATIMAIFSILFGTRSIDSSESHRGMMLAIAFESIVKLLAFFAVGLFAVYSLYDGFTDLFIQGFNNDNVKAVFTNYSDPSVYLTHALIGGIAIFALPRQFHVAVVEYRSEKDLKTARWMFPLYLLLINLFVLPLALVAILQQDLFSSYEFITMQIPMVHGQTWLALVAYIGGLSAGTSMVIIASITLATMVSNEIILPLLIKFRLQGEESALKNRVINIRRAAIVVILLLAFFYYRLLSSYHSLSELGLLSFVAISQFAPAMLIGLIWHGANRKGAYWGLCSGFVVWCYCLFLPVLCNAGWISSDYMLGPFEIEFLRPYSLLGLSELNPIVHGTFWSLLLNTTGLILGSLYHKPSFSDQEQAQRFVNFAQVSTIINKRNYVIKIDDLRALLNRFINPSKVQTLFQQDINPFTGRLISKANVSDEMLKSADRLLSSVLGRRGALLLLRNLLEDKNSQYSNLNIIMDEVSEVVMFNRDLLNSVLHSLNQCITVIDENFNLVAWNQKFSALYDFPNGFLYVGLSAETVVRFIAQSGGYGKGDVDELVTARMNEVRERIPLNYVRLTSDGRYIELTGRPISANRYVTIYSDITEYRNIEDELRKTNEILEHRVVQRTQELTQLNENLHKANSNKTRFLAAAGHDLVQPLNSASLFSASIINKLNRLPSSNIDEKEALIVAAKKLDASLISAESLLNELLEISKLDANIVRANIQSFPIAQVINSLIEEFTPLLEQKNIELHFVNCSSHVISDPVLLRRILQNLLSNALKYCQTGKILVGARRHQSTLEIRIYDTGIGMPDDQLKLIFDEFHRIPNSYTEHEKGLGLGLSIVQRLCTLLDHAINVHSVIHKGSCFSVSLPITEKPIEIRQPSHHSNNPNHSSKQLILCLDNEQQILDGMESLLDDWGYEVVTALNTQQAIQKLNGIMPTLTLVDYHLDLGVTGLQAITQLHNLWQCSPPCIMITADYTEAVKQEIDKLGFQLLKKPVKAMALRACIHHLIT